MNEYLFGDEIENKVLLVWFWQVVVVAQASVWFSLAKQFFCIWRVLWFMR